jgi:repressor LexA
MQTNVRGDKMLIATDEQIIKAIVELGAKGYPPSIREIGKAVGLKSSSTVQKRLIKLKNQGKIEWEPTHVRTLRVISHV